jgi:FAD/FMN-containing dehydrogenase
MGTLADASKEKLFAELGDILGQDNVLAGAEDTNFFSADVFSKGETVDAVIKPGTVDELSRAVKACTDAGWIVIPRGGGFSYTGGYIPVSEKSITVDLRRLDKIIEINEEDMYVTVEVGCTWRTLYDALKAKGMRTPYFGPVSGFRATVGGALSQGSFFLGSTQYGTTADTVLALEVVLANGSIIRTGSTSSSISQSPFYRWYGPDLTGLFLADTGAMGFKTKASLKLIPFPEHQRFGTFAFDTIEQSIAVVSEISRRGLAGECYCWDPYFVKSMASMNSIGTDIKYLRGVVGSGSSLLGGLKDAARIALAGKKIFDGGTYLVNAVIDEVSDVAAEEKLKLIQAIVAKNDGGEIPSSAPRAMRGMPFNDFNHAAYQQSGRRSLPTNGLCPHSQAPALAADIHRYFAEQQSFMDEAGITWGIIVFAVGSTAICIEPLFYWNDDYNNVYDRVNETTHFDALAKRNGPPAVIEAVKTMRKGLVDVFTRNGCVHVQIGKAYPWNETRDPATLKLLQTLKDIVDPNCLVNRGSLGFEPHIEITGLVN